MRGFFIKLVIGVVGLIILWKFGSIDLAVLARAADQPALLAAAFLCLLVTVPIAAFRWWLLLRGLQFKFGFSWTLSTTFISLFFHTFLPGAHGGDLVRLAMAYRATGEGLNRLTFSVITDRLSGLLALLLLGLGTLPVLPGNYANRLAWIAAVAMVALAAGIVIAVSTGDLFARLFAKLPAPVGPLLAHILRELLGALRAYLAQPVLLAAAIVISVVQYALALAALYVLGHAMRFEGLSWSGYVIAGAWSLVANSLPVTPGGIGVGEAAFAHVASILTVASSQDASFGTVFLAMRVLTLILGMIAIVPWLTHRTDLRRGLAEVKANEEADKRIVPAPR
jgi:uncharacterized protein (TIRG00374 family)